MTPFVTVEEETEHNQILNYESVVPGFCRYHGKGRYKQKGIDEIIARFGFKLEETISFGDGGNDIMLRHAAIGVAMGNAKEVKQAADYVTASIDDDGIAKALKHFGQFSHRKGTSI